MSSATLNAKDGKTISEQTPKMNVASMAPFSTPLWMGSHWYVNLSEEQGSVLGLPSLVRIKLSTVLSDTTLLLSSLPSCLAALVRKLNNLGNPAGPCVPYVRRGRFVPGCLPRSQWSVVCW